MKQRVLRIILICITFPILVCAQKNDSVVPPPRPIHRNVIKFNPTPMVLWSPKNLTFSYERILSPRQSISVELGYLVFEKFVEDSLINLANTVSSQKWGMNATVEYRFYITKLNTRPIPFGLFFGPYLTHYGYHVDNGLDIFQSTVDTAGRLKGDFWSVNLGIEMGYQFVFWKRLTLDLVIVGPSASYYGGQLAITGDLSQSQIEDMNQEFYDDFIEQYPAFKNLSLDKNFKQTGKLDVFRWGFRYLFQIGFHF